MTELAGGGQGRSKSAPEWPEFGFGAVQRPQNWCMTPEMDLNQSQAVGGKHFGSISGVIDQFGGLWTAPKPNSGHSGADFDLP